MEDPPFLAIVAFALVVWAAFVVFILRIMLRPAG